MIQRIQSIFLVIAAGLFAYMSFFSPIWVLPNEELMAQDDTKMFVLCLSSMLLTLIALFVFANRRLQMKLIRLTIITELIISVRMYLVTLEHNVSIGTNTYLLLAAAFIALILAYRGVKKDDDLVRSADRVR
jgi:hypothetical protein